MMILIDTFAARYTYARKRNETRNEKKADSDLMRVTNKWAHWLQLKKMVLIIHM